jgi:hypothetical protein
MSQLLLHANPWITELCFAKENTLRFFCYFLLLFYRILKLCTGGAKICAGEKCLRSS